MGWAGSSTLLSLIVAAHRLILRHQWWLLRLQLALFYIFGKYDRWINCLLGELISSLVVSAHLSKVCSAVTGIMSGLQVFSTS